jgi:hypothetical protein
VSRRARYQSRRPTRSVRSENQRGNRMEFIGSTLMALAILGGALYGGFVLWRRGKLTRLTFLPKPPPPPESKA